MASFTDFVSRHWREMLTLTGEHFLLVLAAISVAVAVGLPTGILLTRRPALKRSVLGVANILQTIPSLALFGFLIPLPLIGGIGERTAIVALVLYALLPIVRNTVTGIEGVDRHVREAALAMGMTDGQILRQVELPLAMNVILAGVRVAAVICVGVATIAAAIGAGGLGVYIFRGLRMYDNTLILAGAVPAALMALVADYGIGRLESRLGATARSSSKANKPRKRVLLTRIAWSIAGLLCVILGLVYFAAERRLFQGENKSRLVVGSKDFTEQVVLGELLAQTAEAAGFEVERQFELGGNLCHDALVAGRIDLYPEYTGTAFTAILRHVPISNAEQVYETVKKEYADKFAVEVSDPLGFSNDFAILVRGADARGLNLKTVSEAASYAPGWRAGFGQDFMSRADGYAGFTKAYNLSFNRHPLEMDLSLTYRALAAGEVDVIAGNSTDGLISALDLYQLEDDRRYFPPYQAVVLTRRDALLSKPLLREALAKLSGSISTEDMRRLNYEADAKKRDIKEVVREWLLKRES
ncbi:MAG: ABC transporter permease/substrate-binding protein [Pyrinomonadaceae bacterium]